MDVTEEMRLTDRQRYWLEQVDGCTDVRNLIGVYLKLLR